MYISGFHTDDEWNAFVPFLLDEGTDEQWEIAFNDFFFERLRTRYFVPIDTLTNLELYEGEGFSIVVIQCSLIEFLQATIMGLKYRHLKWGEKPSPPSDFEYHQSGPKFKEFLLSEPEFKSVFEKDDLAQSFYDCVRNGLLHEARTKENWRIQAESCDGVYFREEGSNRILYRNNFQEALKKAVEGYRKRLMGDKDLKDAFIRKINHLCES